MLVLDQYSTRQPACCYGWCYQSECCIRLQPHPLSLYTFVLQLAALQYQAYFLDRTEANSVVGFCKWANFSYLWNLIKFGFRPTEFLPVEYSTVRNISEKVYKEQQTLTGYTRQLSQEVYIHTCSTLPTSSTIFFPVKVCMSVCEFVCISFYTGA